MLAEPIAETMLVVDALEAAGVPYAIGGSLASALRGVMRATLDVDVVADLYLDQVEPFARLLGEAFYADPQTMREAVRQRGSFNLIHLDTAFRVGVFVARPRDFDRAQLARRQPHILSEEPERRAYFTTAEDIILAKLEWYRLGAEISERQWRDVLGVLEVQGERLDLAYLRELGWMQVSQQGKNPWQGWYERQGQRLWVHARSGVGDVVVHVGSRRLRAECKGGPLVQRPGSQEYPRLRGALGQALTVDKLEPHDVLVVAVPHTSQFQNLADKWGQAPLVVRSGIQIVLVGRDGGVTGLDL